jgi:uncharacterized protein with FMN-binding domain
MSRNRYTQKSNFGVSIKRLFVSGFVVFSFVAYAIHERLAGLNPATNTIARAKVPSAETAATTGTNRANAANSNGSPASFADAGSAANNGSGANQASAAASAPTAAPPTAPTAAPQGQYKDGTYTGPVVNVFYGQVQIQATVQNGQVSDVQFLQYPSDRRTSQFINSQAMPWLTQEAIQAQSSNVNIISGATLTSEGFIMSLQSALSAAKNN